jgi:hypothetical protein
MKRLIPILIGVGLLIASFGCGSKETMATDDNGKFIMTDAEKEAIMAEREKYGF